MPRGVIVRPGKFRRNPNDYRAIAMRRQKTDNDHGKWEMVTRWGYKILCPNLHETHELLRFIGPRCGFHPPSGVVDDGYESWLLDHHFKIVNYGRPTGRREMLFAEFIRGWIPSEQDLITGKASPGITDGEMEERVAGPATFEETLASMIAASMAV
ncbi:MAG: hypothetical protein ACRDNK_21525 [Solirubrobacteraceae bacterium]